MRTGGILLLSLPCAVAVVALVIGTAACAGHTVCDGVPHCVEFIEDASEPTLDAESDAPPSDAADGR
jgi:hypothetical protein